jgi:DNA processing protein|tara:strand:- start:2520 stop:3374 length:855 start_codon:yes stop_codon:yes gene_type:complete
MEHAIRQLSQSDFPELLHEIPDKPKELFVMGTLPSKDTKLLCVVGSRKYTPYGREVCEKLIADLRGYDVAIVSGLALGIDSIAHRAALAANIQTIAVPGSGLGEKVLYPAIHRGLAKQIVDSGGALLSEFQEDFQATPYSFPQRNRIMAGLSHVVLVIEAIEKSGTLITSRLALEYNRDVCTVPGSIFSKNSHGPHMLIRLGAVPVSSSKELFEVLGIEQSEKNVQDNTLSDTEQKVIKLLEIPMPRDELIQKLNIPVQDANVLLSSMEIKGLITERMGELHVQ